MKRNVKGHFCIPADFKQETLDQIKNLNTINKSMIVEELYGNIPATPYGSGRSAKSLKNIDMDGLEVYVKRCSEIDVSFNYTFNALTIGNREFNKKDSREILRFIEKLTDIGIRRFTVTLPSIISLLSNSFPESEIVLSVINGVSSSYQLNELLDSGNIIRAYVTEDLNRKIHRLKKLIKDSPIPLATIVNGFCLFECAYRVHHYNFNSFGDVDDKVDRKEYYGARCNEIKVNNPAEILRIPWIRPNDIQKYISIGINWFKITGREMIKLNADFIRTAEIYMSGDYNGDMIDLLMNFSNHPYKKIFSLNARSLEPYFEGLYNRELDCGRDYCKSCKYCEQYSGLVSVYYAAIDELPKFSMKIHRLK